eukprot:Pompholyxophrys_punicea_v1_NODE_1271_length_827_cov_2.349741.p1 type:complete len:129 gc:universal NODE_1271_length_827_cov_2.349741:82-468(+)
MLRKRGWFLRGHKPVYKSLFQRGSRLSYLAFLGVDGLFEAYETQDTFNRLLFLECVDKLLDSGKVQQWPGKRSIWVMDNARIHSDPKLVEYLSSRGIIVVYLPQYSPFYNPIEIVFGQVKKRLTLSSR